MANYSGWGKCAGCGKERQITSRGRIVSHRKWTGKGMITCPGSLLPPAAVMRTRK
jgi:hypothetical protein